MCDGSRCPICENIWCCCECSEVDFRMFNGYCPCGYKEECAVHCGKGHENGMCTPWPTTS